MRGQLQSRSALEDLKGRRLKTQDEDDAAGRLFLYQNIALTSAPRFVTLTAHGAGPLR